MQKRLLSFVIFAALFFGLASMVNGQVAHTFTGSSLTYNQNFDGMGAAGTSYPTGWTGQRAAGSGTNGALLNPVATNGSAFSGAVYNVGAAGSTDRALATLASGSTAPAIGAAFVNGTGSTITSLTIAGFLEQWRSASRNDINEVIAFSYSFDASDVFSPTATWTSDSTLDLNEILISTTSATAVNGNDSANRMALTGTLSLNWAHGDTLWVRWRDNDDPGSDGMYGLDDMVFTAATGAASTNSAVTFSVDMQYQTVSTNGVHIAGNFQGWNPAGTPMVQSTTNPSVYTYSATFPIGDTLQYKFVNGNSWGNYESVPGACAVNNNRFLVVAAGNPVLPAIVFGTCNITVPPVSFYSINQINGVDSNGVADSLGLPVRVSGTLYGINQSTNGIQFAMIDGTAGVTIRSASNTFGITNAAEGDSLVVEGTVSQFRGLLQIAVDTAWRVSTGATLKQPTLVTDVNESTENDLIRVNNLTIVSGSWPTAAGQSRNITVTNGTATFTMRILGGTNIGGTTPPSGFFDLIGLGGQFSSSATGPFTDGYQVFPRSSSDIIPVVVTTPTVNFIRPDTAVTNQTGAINMAMSILNPVSTPAQIKIRYNNSPGANYGSTWETFPPRVGDTITVNVAANATTANFSVLLFNTVPAGRNDTINFTIAAATGGLQPGTINSARIRVSNPPAAPISNATIGQIRGANTNGIADSIGVNVRTTGVVLGFNKRAAGLEFTIFDRTSNAGIGVFRASGNGGYNVTEGDSIRIMGNVSHFNGLSQINPDSIVLISTGNSVPTPSVVTAMSETTESRLIRINNLTVVDPTQWPVAGTTGSGRTVVVNDGTSNFDLRIPSGVDVFGTPAPVGTFDLIGVGGQFFSANPHIGGYQIIPRYLADIVISGATQDSLKDFALLSPANNATLRVEGPGSTSVDITWEATSFTGGPASITYSWLVDLPTGDFSSPLATIPSNNGGADTALTLNFTQIAALLTANSIPIGGSATLKWTVVANRDMGAEMKMAVMPFNITLERGIISSVAALNPLDGMKLYPNPATDRTYLSYALPKASDLQVEVLNTIGKRVKIDLIHFSEAGVHEIDIAGLPEGIYFIRLSNAEFSAVRRLVVKR